MQGFGGGQALLLLDSLLQRILSTLAPSLISRYLTPVTSPGVTPHTYAAAAARAPPRTASGGIQRRMTGQVSPAAVQAMVAGAAASAGAPAASSHTVASGGTASTATPTGTSSSTPGTTGGTPAPAVSLTSAAAGPGQKSEKPVQRVRDELTQEVGE
jgi:hypothetical protein